MKTILFTLALLLSPALLAEANIRVQPGYPTYLLEAPGTVSGIGEPKPSRQQRLIPPRAFVTPDHEPSMGGQYRFPQYGQKPANPNPWFEDRPELRPTRPPAANAERPRQFQNPWDIGNLPDFGPPRFDEDGLTGSNSRLVPNYGSSYGLQGLDSGYSSYYRDPYSGRGLPAPMGFPYSGLPLMNGMLPGLSDNDSDFPFMPFDLF